MKYKKKIGAIILSICLLLPIFSIVSYAASGSVSVSSKSGNVGSTVTITCTVKCSTGAIGTADVVLVYDQSSLQYVSGSGGYSLTGGSGSVVYSGLTSDGTSSSLSFTVSFKILKAGTHTVSVSSANAYDIDEVQFAPSKGSGKITGKAPTTTTPSTPDNDDTPQNNKDTNNKLSALQVYPGTLSPAFSADTTSYTVTVPSDTTEVTISAKAASNKAAVTVSGGKDLKLGANEAKVIVVAESGASRAYTLTIMCGEAEKIQIGGVENTINENFTDEQIPTGFSRKQVTYNDRQYEAVTNASGSLTLINLQSGENSSFYIYNQETQEFYDFVQITLAEGKYIIPLPLSEEVAEFAEHETVTFQVQGKSFDAWKLDEEFGVAYVMNQDGVETLYRYDSIDGTFQRHVDIEVEDVEQTPVEEKTWFPNEYYMYAIVGLGAFSLILLIAMIYFIASRKVRHEGRKRKAIKKQEKQKAKEEKQREKEQKEIEEHRRLLEEEREKQRQIEEKKLAKQRAKEEKKLARQEKKEK